jgi:putative SOS response-associated peptidase YedK
MKAWSAYQETDEFKNAFKWVTAEQRRALPKFYDKEANAVTEEQRDQWAQGSMWAAFMAGFEAAGGKVRF